MIQRKILLGRCNGHYFVQITLIEFHDDEEAKQIIVVLFGRDKNVNKLDGMYVIFYFRQLPHDLYLTNDLDAVVLTFADVSYKFDGNVLFGKFALGFDNLAKTSLPDDLE
jgi:hypothetical protein